jgi:hypothetical protein
MERMFEMSTVTDGSIARSASGKELLRTVYGHTSDLITYGSTTLGQRLRDGP